MTRLFNWLPDWPFTKILLGAALAMMLAIAALTTLLMNARDRAALAETERDRAVAKVSEEQSRRRGLAAAVLARMREIDDLNSKSESLQIALDETEAKLLEQSRKKMKEADRQREKEGVVDEPLFDTLGIR